MKRLPQEGFEQVTWHLPQAALDSLSRVCRQFAQVTVPTLYRRVFLRTPEKLRRYFETVQCRPDRLAFLRHFELTIAGLDTDEVTTDSLDAACVDNWIHMVVIVVQLCQSRLVTLSMPGLDLRNGDRMELFNPEDMATGENVRGSVWETSMKWMVSVSAPRVRSLYLENF